MHQPDHKPLWCISLFMLCRPKSFPADGAGLFPALDTVGQKGDLNKYVDAIHVTWNRGPVKFEAPTKQQLGEHGYVVFDVKTGTLDWSPNRPMNTTISGS